MMHLRPLAASVTLAALTMIFGRAESTPSSTPTLSASQAPLAPAPKASTPPSEPDAKPDPVLAPFVGTYYRGDGTGFNLYLTLNKDGSFVCRWRGCLGDYGKSSGRWSGDEHLLKLRTEEADGILKDRPIGDLEVGQANGKAILIQINNRNSFDQRGASRSSCFHREGETRGL